MLMQVSTGLEALSYATQGFQPSPRGLFANEFQVIASVCPVCSTAGAKPKRLTNMCGHFVRIMHCYLPEGIKIILVPIIIVRINNNKLTNIQINKLSLLITGIMPNCHAYTFTR